MPSWILTIGANGRFALFACLCLLPLRASSQPLSDSDFVSAVQPLTGSSQFVLAGEYSDTSFVVAILVDHKTPLRGITIPLSFAGLEGLRVDSSIHEVSRAPGITYGPLGSSPPWALRSAVVDYENKTILIGFVSYSDVSPSADTLCYIHFLLDSGVSNLSIQLDTTALPPSNHLSIADDHANEYVPTWSPLTITIGAGNFAPVLSTIGGQSAKTNSRLLISVSATDQDGAAPVLSASDLPIDASFEDHGSGSGSFNWVPSSSQVGYHNITFRASDGVLTDSEVVSVLVTSTDTPPVLDSIGDQFARVDLTLNFVVYATDSEGSIPALRAVGLPLGASFLDQGDGSGVFDWTPTWSQNGYYDLIFIATDDTFEDSEKVELFVTKSGNYDSDSDFLELIVPGTGAHDLYLPSGSYDTTFILALMVKNATPLRAIVIPLTFAGLVELSIDASIMTRPDMVGVTYGPAGHASKWSARISNITNRNTPQSILLAFLQYEEFSPHDDTLCYIHFKLSATNTKAVVPVDTSTLPPYNTFDMLAYERGSWLLLRPRWQPLTLHIGNEPPALAHPGNQAIMEGHTLNFKVTAVDPDGTTPMLSMSPLPGGATFIDHGNGTATFDWTPSKLQTGVHSVTFQASDGILRDSETVVITVGGSSAGADPAVIPTSFELSQNYPNPFNAATGVRYSLPEAANVRLDVYDVLGRHVSTLFSGVRSAGWYEVEWNGRNGYNIQVGSGVYFIVFETGARRIIRNAVLLK